MTTIQAGKNEKKNENYRSVTDKQHSQTKNVCLCVLTKDGEYLKAYFIVMK
jgi:hypothetical protein